VYDDLNNIFGRIYDTSGGGSLSAEFEIDQPTIGGILPAVAATADGGFIVTWYRFLNGNYDIVARRYNSDGVAMQSFTVNRLTDGDQVWPTVAVSGANAFFAWTDLTPRPSDPDPPSVRGQVMSLTTPPDFNDDARADILWRNDSGALAEWFMKGTAIVGTATPTFGGAAVTPDGSWTVQAKPTDFA
jgi:hypothetical protein